MNLHRFLATWAGLTLENRVNRLIILLLIGVNCVLAVTINQTDRTVVYGATSTEEPVSLYISAGQSNDLVLSLTLRHGGFAAVCKGSAVEDHGWPLPMLHMPPGRVMGTPADYRDRH